MKHFLKLIWALAPVFYNPCRDHLNAVDPTPEVTSNLTSRSRPFTILVEGNVGSGKSTTLGYFDKNRDKFDIDVVFEPVAQWQNISGTDLLGEMFKDSKRWSGPFQSYSSLTRYRNVFAATPRRFRIMERSIFTERYCFLETMRENPAGISEVEYELMKRWFSLMTTNFWDKLKPDLIVYVRCDIDILKERIRKRGRPEEKNLDPAFLAKIQAKHDAYLLPDEVNTPPRSRPYPPPPAPVLVLDGNLPLERFLPYLETKVDQILGRRPV